MRGIRGGSRGMVSLSGNASLGLEKESIAKESIANDLEMGVE
jgi:hypothetical protein